EAEAITTESQIREINPELFDFADWLISNRTNYTNEELLQRVEGIRPLNENIGGELQKVWNNVFYQTTSQKSFELKESLMQLLTADNLIRRVSGNEEE